MDLTSGALATLFVGFSTMAFALWNKNSNDKVREGEWNQWRKYIDNKINEMPATTQDISKLTKELAVSNQQQQTLIKTLDDHLKDDKENFGELRKTNNNIERLLRQLVNRNKEVDNPDGI